MNSQSCSTFTDLHSFSHDQTKLSKNQKEKIEEVLQRKPREFIHVTTFVFSLQSTNTLTALGFEDVPTWIPQSTPVKAPKPKKAKKSDAEADAEDDDNEEEGKGSQYSTHL